MRALSKKGNRIKYGRCCWRGQVGADFPILPAFAMTKRGAKRTSCDASGCFSTIGLPDCNAGARLVVTDMPARPGAFARIVRWVRFGFARPRPADIMIVPEPAVLAAWRGLLGLPPRDQN